MYGTSQRSFISLPTDGPLTRRDRPGSGDSRHSVSSARGENLMGVSTGAVLDSLYTSQTLPGPGKENSRSGGAQTVPIRMPGSTLSLSSSQAPNVCVKMPFKHDIRKPSQTPQQEPAQGMKEMTAMATYHVTQMLTEEVMNLTQKQRGRLKKGRLKPLYPVHISGPSIRQCRGILAETRSYSASASRTLQRRRHIVSQLKSGALKISQKAASPRDDESVHRVSAASSVEDLAEDGGHGRTAAAEEKAASLNGDFQAELASMERDAMFETEDMEDKETFGKEETVENKEDTADNKEDTVDNKEDTADNKEDTEGNNEDAEDRKEADSAPPSVEQNINGQQNIDVNHSNPCLPSQPTPSTEAQTGEEANGDHQQSTAASSEGISSTTPPGQNVPTGSEESAYEETKELKFPTKNNLVTASASKNTPIAPLKLRRPVSAGVNPSSFPLTTSPLKARPQTAASGKTVRFADHVHSSDGQRLPMSKSNSWLGKGRGGRRADDKGRGKERRSSAGESCRPSALDNRYGHDDEDEGDNRGGKKRNGRDRLSSAGKNGYITSGSARGTGQGGESGQVSDSQASPQDGNGDVAAEFRHATASSCAVVSGRIGVQKSASSDRTSRHQQSLPEEGSTENYHLETVSSSQKESLPPKAAANQSLTQQPSSRPQTLAFLQDSQEHLNHAESTPSCPECQNQAPATIPEIQGQSTPVTASANVEPKSSGCQPRNTPPSDRCLCSNNCLDDGGGKGESREDRSMLQGGQVHVGGAGEGRHHRPELPDTEVSALTHMQDWLQSHCQRWFSTVLV